MFSHCSATPAVFFHSLFWYLHRLRSHPVCDRPHRISQRRYWCILQKLPFRQKGDTNLYLPFSLHSIHASFQCCLRIWHQVYAFRRLALLSHESINGQPDGSTGLVQPASNSKTSAHVATWCCLYHLDNRISHWAAQKSNEVLYSANLTGQTAGTVAIRS